MISIRNTLIALAIGAGTLASAGSASAYVACNNTGDCWHTDTHYNYKPDVHVQYHKDDWYFHQTWQNNKEHTYRDYHEGRGGYRNGVWFSF